MPQTMLILFEIHRFLMGPNIGEQQTRMGLAMILRKDMTHLQKLAHQYFKLFIF